MAPTLTRRERERQRHRREILEAALACFAERGFEQTTMTEVADRAEFAVGTLYKFFRNKQDLYQALVTETVRTFSSLIMKALRGSGNEVDCLERFIDQTTRLFFERREAARIYLSQTVRHPDAAPTGLQGEALQLHNEVTAVIEDLFRSGSRKGLFVDMDPHLLRIGMQGVSNALFAEVLNEPRAFTLNDVADCRKRMFFDAVRLKPRLRLNAAR
jgi:AcrR family transcriptional regulator